MSLSSELASQFAKSIKSDDKKKSEEILYGTFMKNNGRNYVKIDGSELLTPVDIMVAAKQGERVSLVIKNHTAVVTGNLTSPAARSGDVEDVKQSVLEVNTILADKVSTKELDTQIGRIDDLISENAVIKNTLKATNASIDNLTADNVVINKTLVAQKADIDDLRTTTLTVKVAEATYATIENLKATDADIYNLTADYGDFKSATAETLKANQASINDLSVKKLDAESAKVTYANIDFSNIEKAAIENFYATSGIIKDLVIGDTSVTGELVGVTIKGDLIEGGTVVADKLVVKGKDGLYYKLNTDGVRTEAQQTEYNSLNGSVITAKSITAAKINVKDLVAFDATIGGFTITDSSIYSGAKSSAENTTRGIFLGKDGQISFGDESNFIRYRKDQNGNYRMQLSAGLVSLNSKGIFSITGNKFVVDSTNLVIHEDGSVDCSNLNITGGSITVTEFERNKSYISISSPHYSENSKEWVDNIQLKTDCLEIFKTTENKNRYHVLIDPSGYKTTYEVNENNEWFGIEYADLTSLGNRLGDDSIDKSNDLWFSYSEGLHIPDIIHAGKKGINVLYGSLYIAKSNTGSFAKYSYDQISLDDGRGNGVEILNSGDVRSNMFHTPSNKVSIWEDNEGGNIQITSPNGVSYQMDSFDDNFRLYWYDQNKVISSFAIARENGLYMTGDNWQAIISRSKLFVQNIINADVGGDCTIYMPIVDDLTNKDRNINFVARNGNKDASYNFDNITFWDNGNALVNIRNGVLYVDGVINGVSSDKIVLYKNTVITNGASIFVEGHISSVNGKISMWEDNEGGNLQITSNNGVSYQMDAVNGNFRMYWFKSDGNVCGFTVYRDTGNISFANGDSIYALRNSINELDYRKIATTSNSDFYKINTFQVLRSSNNAMITAELGNYIWGISNWSDKRLKENVRDSEVNALDKIDQIRFRSFDFIDKRYGDHEELGYIADELKDIFPECVALVPQDKDACGYDELYQVEDKAMIKYLGKAIQELHSIIKNQSKTIEQLKKSLVM